MKKIAAWFPIAAGAIYVFAFFTGMTSMCLFCNEDREAYNTAKECGTIICYKKYLTFFPNGDYRIPVTRAVHQLQMLQDEADWKIALRCGTIKCYTIYMNSNKNGAFFNEARRKIAELKKQIEESQKRTDRTEEIRRLKEAPQRELNEDLQRKRERELQRKLDRDQRRKQEGDRKEEVARPQTVERQKAHDSVRIVGQYVQFRKVTNGVITGGRSANATAAFILENLGGQGFDAAIEKGSVFIGSCISSTWMSVRGLSSYNDAKLFDRLKTFVPAYAKVPVILKERCPMENLSSVDVGATITISQGGRMFSLPLSAPNVPVRY